MNSYSFLAQNYDDLTSNIPYNLFIDYYKTAFAKDSGEFRLILDLCCGTGTISIEMAKTGYDMISVDASSDMLMVAQNKAYSNGVSPMFICQKAEELDLYGCVDACISSLDSFNYIEPSKMSSVLNRLHLFIRPNGLLIFDIRSEQWLNSLNNTTSAVEGNNSYCIWNTIVDSNVVTYKMDIFSRNGELYKRESEIHNEFIYSQTELENNLKKAGFDNIKFLSTGPQGADGRVFVICKNICKNT